MGKLVEYQLVRIAKLLHESADRDGWGVNQHAAAVGDIGTLLEVLHAAVHRDRYVVEHSGPDGTTIWLDDFDAEELDPV